MSWYQAIGSFSGFGLSALYILYTKLKSPTRVPPGLSQARQYALCEDSCLKIPTQIPSLSSNWGKRHKELHPWPKTPAPAGAWTLFSTSA